MKPSIFLFAASALCLSVFGHANLGAAAAFDTGAAADSTLPLTLRDTGFYAPGAAGALREGIVAFSPQYPLWSDGADKRRWLYLPAGSFIDASQTDAWEFPRGTKLWKEFSHEGRAVETRYIERQRDGSWRFATYVWNEAGDEAMLAPAGGIPALPVRGAPGGRYAVPSRADCLACHGSTSVPVLGASALQLSSNPLAFSAAAVLTFSPPVSAADSASTTEAKVARGKYLVSTSGCMDCHTPMKMGPNGVEFDMSRMLSGHPETLQMPPAPALPEGPWLVVSSATNTAFSGPWGVSFTANLTPDADTGLDDWTARDFKATIRTGRHMGRGRAILPPMPIPVYNNFTDQDLDAIFAYLRTIPAVKNRVPEPRPTAAAARQ